MDGHGSAETTMIKAAASGNVGAFSQLVREYRPRVLRTAYGIVASAVADPVAEAEDIAQEVFIKVWNKLPDYHSRGAFASWLYRITVNTSIDTLRRRRRNPEVTSRAPFQDSQPDPIESPEKAAVRKDARQQVREAIATLPPNARVTLILREYEQLSYREIAETLQIPTGTVMSRLNYARKLLRQALAAAGIH